MDGEGYYLSTTDLPEYVGEILFFSKMVHSRKVFDGEIEA